MIKLNYFPIDSTEKPVNLVFKTYEDFTAYLYNVALVNHNSDKEPVYLLAGTINSENLEYSFNFVDDNLDLISEIIKGSDFNVFNVWYLQEYESYEGAYEVALLFKEGHELYLNK